VEREIRNSDLPYFTRLQGLISRSADVQSGFLLLRPYSEQKTCFVWKHTVAFRGYATVYTTKHSTGRILYCIVWGIF